MLYFILLLTFIQPADCQKKLDEINTSYQNCLDEGKIMVNCSQTFLSEMDQLLYEVLTDIKESFTNEQVDSLLQNQKDWELRREHQSNLLNNRLDSLAKVDGMVSQDDRMFTYNEKALFIEKRIQELILHLK
ncbi:hypothetical protein [Algoriphagus vanfongensis]|uniref:hypothetical protein n=1 Tax=Algoriphagus vanfongensis TaxID=426371 RepID=UPI000478A6CE|nr:hypothetical protein [Algoriphagus vanfongensis]